MLKRLFFAFLVPALLIALPVVMRQRSGALPEPEKDMDTLIVVTPHTEPIKYEFEHSFRRLYREKTGRNIRIDWRSVGGTSDIVRYINDRYTAAFRLAWLESGHDFTDADRKSFADFRRESEIRKAFLSSDTGIEIDVFFGGGTYDHQMIADKGYSVDAGVLKRHPEYFSDIPQTFSGETIYDPQGRFYGCCLASFGIALNPDRFQERGMSMPENWIELTEDAFFNEIVLADPTKSGSVMKCYEMILQQAMAELGPEQGWIEGSRRIKLIAANARAVTDSAGKAVREVSTGNAMAGMSIDFYSFSERDWTEKTDGHPHVVYQMPPNGSAVTADPVSLLRGAPNRKQAEMFLDFLMSPEGQRLWLQKAGTPGGPEKYTLLRSSVKRDLPKQIDRAYLSNPDYEPYHLAGTFRYHGEWTGRYFTLIRILIKCIALDPIDDLTAARKAIRLHGGDAENAEALAEIAAMPFSYGEASQMAAKLSRGSAADAAKLRREWTEFALQHYRTARRLAEEKEVRP